MAGKDNGECMYVFMEGTKAMPAMPRTLLSYPEWFALPKKHSSIPSNRKTLKSSIVWIHCKKLGTILIKDRSYRWSWPEKHLHPSLLGTNTKNPEATTIMLTWKLQARSCICEWNDRTDHKKNVEDKKKKKKKNNKNNQLAKYIN